MSENSPTPAPEIPIPAPFDQLGDRHFSFYPTIIGIEHNEWTCASATWSEIRVRNAKTEQELWIPRSWVGELSRIEQPVAIIGLKRELEFRLGRVWPFERRVLAMPKANTSPLPPSAAEAASAAESLLAAGRLESNERHIGRLILAALALGILGCALAIVFYRGRNSAENVSFTGVLQANLGLNSQDDYHAVVRKLGPPAADQSKAGNGEGNMQYRVLRYPDRNVSVVLMGRDPKDVRYIGAVDSQWRVVDSVNLPGGVNTASMIRRMPRF